ncbi:MAG: hypothetical protein A3B92_03745 [Candidatus Harrisonbacteria bacterium RIFCSPHIGHO2_02_FULL_42_16]|uniref:Peptidase M50 domain-containing protein n=1 Tax=Candidatus Harrisonbacteria bacterium RIFCSPHIGHO2_02_FULL_42_16 TaxID=1798404 RepID=A0A1G1ZH86_9BACT|nr:MAG: hypothetical protein A3B92_03745 [Candidatus Harrisonbacteria bacterium RIFCSPHIGHO2_02_FULL_42_16]
MDKLFLYIVIILSATFHEFAHGFVAHKLGDDTAKNQGRLTLNPLAHIDLIGTILVPLFLLLTSGIFIGWAKPVPYNPNNLSDRRYGSLKVGIAGPAANLLIAFILGLPLRFSYLFLSAGVSPLFLELVSFIVLINIFLALFNLIPFPPLDGSKVFADLFPRQWASIMRLGSAGIIISLLISFYFLPPVAQTLFWLITGQLY